MLLLKKEIMPSKPLIFSGPAPVIMSVVVMSGFSTNSQCCEVWSVHTAHEEKSHFSTQQKQWIALLWKAICSSYHIRIYTTNTIQYVAYQSTSCKPRQCESVLYISFRFGRRLLMAPKPSYEPKLILNINSSVAFFLYFGQTCYIFTVLPELLLK